MDFGPEAIETLLKRMEITVIAWWSSSRAIPV